jgi:hypothetical protein
MNEERPTLDLTRFAVSAHAAKGHALASESRLVAEENPQLWAAAAEAVRQALLTQPPTPQRQSLVRGFGPPDDGWVYEVERGLLPPDTRGLSSSQRRIIGHLAAALDEVVNGCEFARTAVDASALVGFVQIAQAVASEVGKQRLVRFDRVDRFAEGSGLPPARRCAAALADAGVVTAMYRDHFLFDASLAGCWTDNHRTSSNARGDNYYINGNVAAVGHATVTQAFMQDNREGGQGSIDARQIALRELMASLATEVKARPDAPPDAQSAAAQAADAAKTGDEGTVKSALARGGKWLEEVTKSVASKAGAEWLIWYLRSLGS